MRVVTAKYASRCASCAKQILPGQVIYVSLTGGQAMHYECRKEKTMVQTSKPLLLEATNSDGRRLDCARQSECCQIADEKWKAFSCQACDAFRAMTSDETRRDAGRLIVLQSAIVANAQESARKNPEMPERKNFPTPAKFGAAMSNWKNVMKEAASAREYIADMKNVYEQ